MKSRERFLSLLKRDILKLDLAELTRSSVRGRSKAWCGASWTYLGRWSPEPADGFEARPVGLWRSAGLDVFEQEPKADPALLAMPSVVLTPQLAELRNGDELVLEHRTGQARWAVLTRTGQIVGRTATSYQPPAGGIVTARVAAICVRRLQDVTAQWRSRMAVDAWEVVLPELVIELER